MAYRVISDQWPYMTSTSDILAVIGSQAMRAWLYEVMPDEAVV